jgi:hypothetical protein
MSAVISVGKASARSDYPAYRVPQNLWMLIGPLFAANRPRTNPKQLATNKRPKAPSGGSAKCILNQANLSSSKIAQSVSGETLSTDYAASTVISP